MKDGDLLLAITKDKLLSEKHVKVSSKFDDRNAKLDLIRSNSRFSKDLLEDVITIYKRKKCSLLLIA